MLLWLLIVCLAWFLQLKTLHWELKAKFTNVKKKWMKKKEKQKKQIKCLKFRDCYLKKAACSERLTWRRKVMMSRMMMTILVSWMASRFTSGSKTPERTSWINWSTVPPVVKLATAQMASFWTLKSPCKKRTFTFFMEPEELKVMLTQFSLQIGWRWRGLYVKFAQNTLATCL